MGRLENRKDAIEESGEFYLLSPKSGMGSTDDRTSGPRILH